jgi:hypothetical protein
MSKFELCEKIGLTVIFSFLLTHSNLAISSPSNRSDRDPQISREVNKHAQKSDEYSCEAYAAGYATAKTKQYYIEICGGPNRQNVSFYAIKTNGDPQKAEREKISVDNVSLKTGIYIATQDKFTYTLTPKIFSIQRSGKIIVKEQVIKYTNLSKIK